MLIMGAFAGKIKGLFNKIRKPSSRVPSVLVSMCAGNKPGLSVAVSVRNVMDSMKKFNGDTSSLEDSFMYYMLYAVFDELYRALREDARIDVGFRKFSLMFEGKGFGEVVGSNVNEGVGTGQMS